MSGHISDVRRVRPLPDVKPHSPVDEVLAVLGSPIDERWHREKQIGKGKSLTYIPWYVIARALTARVPGWQWELLEIKQLGEWVTVSGRLTVPCGDTTLSWDGVASEPLNSGSHAPPVESAASAAIRRAAALAGLGLSLYFS